MGLGLGSFLGGLAGSYGEEQLRRQYEQRQRKDRDNQQRMSLLHSLAFDPNATEEARQAAFGMAADLWDEQHKGAKGKDKPINIYRSLGDFMSSGSSGATVAQPIQPGAVGPASIDPAAPPDLFSTSGAHLASPGAMATGAAQGKQPRLFRDPLEDAEAEVRMKGRLGAEFDEAERQRKLTALRQSGATPEQIREAELAMTVGFPMPSRREAQPEYEWIQTADGQWKQVVTGQAPPGSTPESQVKPYSYAANSAGKRYQDNKQHAMQNLGMNEMESERYAKDQEAQHQQAQQALLKQREALNASLLASRASTLEGKQGGKPMDVNTARGILQNAQAYKQRLVAAMVANVINPSAEQLSQFDNQAQDMMERELEQAGITLMDLQDIIAGAAGRNPDVGKGNSALDQIFSSK